MTPAVLTQTILTELLQVLGILLVPLLAWAAQRGLAAYEARMHVQLTDQQRAIVLGAADTAAGVLLVRLGAGTLTRADLTLEQPAVKSAGLAAVQAVPAAAAALDVNAADMTRITLGKVGRALAADPTVPTIPERPAPP